MPRILSFSQDGALLAVAHGPPWALEIRQVATGERVTEFAVPRPSQLAWHPDSRSIAVAGDDLRFSFWDVPAGNRTLAFEGPRGGGVRIEFSRDGSLLAGWGWDGKIRLWDSGSGKLLLSFPGGCSTPAFGPDQRICMVAGNDHRVGIWQVVSGQEFRSLARREYHDACGDLTIHPGGRLLAVGMEDGVELWDLASGRDVGHLPIGTTRHLLFDPSGDLITRGTSGVWRWPVKIEPASGSVTIGPSRMLPMPGNHLQLVQNRNGRVFALAQFDGALVIDLSRPAERVRLAPHADVRYVAVSPDGRVVATGSHSAPAVKVWDVRDQRQIAELPSEDWTELYFSPDGRWLAAGHVTCRVFAADSWSLTAELGGTALGFTPDSRFLAVESGGGAVRLVDPASGREHVRLENPGQERASRVAFGPNGQIMAANSADSSSVHVWNLGEIGRELEGLSLPWQLATAGATGEAVSLPPLHLVGAP
jgi:WD40 repeat protein